MQITLEELLRTAVKVGAADNVSPDFRIAVQEIMPYSVRVIVHALGHDSETCDLTVRGNRCFSPIEETPPTGEFVARMFDEYSDLQRRIEKLKAFIITDRFDTLPEVDRKGLKEQLKHMEGYYRELGYRVSRQCGSA